MNEQHFEVLEIDIPIFTNNEICTFKGGQGGYTPLTCDQDWGGNYKTLKFTSEDAPLLFEESDIYHVINKINENSVEIKPGGGLSARSSASIDFNDFIGDPNKEITGIPDSVKNSGTFFGKLNSRQILTNKSARIKTYKRTSNRLIQLSNPVSVRHYLIDSLINTGKNKWQITLKDELSLLNLDEKTYPELKVGNLEVAVDNVQTVGFKVDADTTYSIGDIVLIDSEFLKITDVRNIGTSTAEFDVAGRNTNILSTTGVQMTKSAADSHSAGTDITICKVLDDAKINDVLFDILTTSGVKSTYINTAEWDNEMTLFHSTSRINTILFEEVDVNDIVSKILNDFLTDMWFDNELQKIKLSAISVWKQSTNIITEGNEIDYGSVRISTNESIRATRAFVKYNKKFLAENDDNVNYSNISIFEDTSLKSPEIYGKVKDKKFDPSVFLDRSSAQLLTQRYVSRFKIQPKVFTFNVQESKLNFSLGDVVSIVTDETQDFLGNQSSENRAQIVSLKQAYSRDGRYYKVKALTYEVAALSGSEIVLNDTGATLINLWDKAGQPFDVVDLVFVIDGGQLGTTDISFPTIVAGNFAAGSKITLILKNGAFITAKGGDGGDGGDLFIKPNDPSISSATLGKPGGDGGTVYDAQGVDTDIYFSGPTGNVNHPVADGYLFAPTGGDAGWSPVYDPIEQIFDSSGDGGNGGEGFGKGLGGSFGAATGDALPGSNGSDGSSDRTIGTWGVDGATRNVNTGPLSPATVLGGLAGKGIVDSGATVNLFFDPAVPTDPTDRYKNGHGDHP